GRALNVSAGSSGFNNAAFYTIPLALTDGPANFPPGTVLTIEVFARRTCTGGGHSSGITRLWYDGKLVDAGRSRAAASRFDASIDGESFDYFLRGGLALDTAPGSSRQFVDVSVDSREACPGRTFKSFGAWHVVP